LLYIVLLHIIIHCLRIISLFNMYITHENIMIQRFKNISMRRQEWKKYF